MKEPTIKELLKDILKRLENIENCPTIKKELNQTINSDPNDK